MCYRLNSRCVDPDMGELLLLCPVPGMLEHESLQGFSSRKPTGFRKRSNSVCEDTEAFTISSILQQLSLFHITVSQHSMEPELIKQVVRQQIYLVGATTLNNILLRKDMCSWRKGMQIRCVCVCLRTCVSVCVSVCVCVFVCVMYRPLPCVP